MFFKNGFKIFSCIPRPYLQLQSQDPCVVVTAGDEPTSLKIFTVDQTSSGQFEAMLTKRPQTLSVNTFRH